MSNQEESIKRSLEGKVDLILEAVISLQGQVSSIQSNYATKDFVEVTVDTAVEKVKEELLAEIRPIGRAVDKDALTIVDYGRRIGRIEKQLA